MPVIDVTEADFQQEVLERSHEVPVVVDFWAEWCGPCRSLTPVLEAEAAAREGDVVLAKVDTDANPRLSQAFRIQGIPAVKAFRDGQIADEFTGALPPGRVREFFDKLVPSEADRLTASGDEASLRRALELDPSRMDAKVALARLLHARGDDDEALALLDNVAGDFAGEGLAARIRLERAGVPVAEPFRAWGDGRHEAAVDTAVALIDAHPDHKDDLRRVVVALLDELGVDHPVARDGRRKLATALY